MWFRKPDELEHPVELPMDYRKMLAYCILLALGCSSCATPHPGRAPVMAAVQQFVDAMVQRDVNASAEVLVPDGVFVSVRTEDGKRVLRNFSNADYMASLGDRDFDVLERLHHPVVLIEGDVATVWTEYEFFKSGELSHTGQDVFNLIRTDDGWKISGGAYTVVPPD